MQICCYSRASFTGRGVTRTAGSQPALGEEAARAPPSVWGQPLLGCDLQLQLLALTCQQGCAPGSQPHCKQQIPPQCWGGRAHTHHCCPLGKVGWCLCFCTGNCGCPGCLRLAPLAAPEIWERWGELCHHHSLSLPLPGGSCLHCAKHPWQELLWEHDFPWQTHFTSLSPTFLHPPLPSWVSLKSQPATSFCLALELPKDWENAAGEPLNERFHASIITLFSQPLHKIAK